MALSRDCQAQPGNSISRLGLLFRLGEGIGMWRPLDTTEEADRIQFEIFGRMGAAEKVRRMSELIELVRATFEAGIRKRHPEYTDRDARLARIRWELGDELYRQAYPREALLDP